jgi:chaperonin cofactor prefoldin
MQNQPSEALLQIQLLKAQLEQIQRVKEFLKNLQPGRKIYIDLGGVMVESNYLEAMEYLEQKEKELRELLLQLEGQLNLKSFEIK